MCKLTIFFVMNAMSFCPFDILVLCLYNIIIILWLTRSVQLLFPTRIILRFRSTTAIARWLTPSDNI